VILSFLFQFLFCAVCVGELNITGTSLTVGVFDGLPVN